MQQVVSAPVNDTRQHRLFWWKEAILAGVFYTVYSWTRNQFGSARASRDSPPYHAFHNAEHVIQIERWLGMFHEESIQDFFLPFKWIIRFMNIYYGTAHFFVTIIVFALLFLKRPAVFPPWRNSLAFMTALAIIGFAWFPLMPPRLLDGSCRAFGGDCIISRFRPIDGTFGFVDTLAHYRGLWSFNSDAMAEISNQYAAMPSLHIGWSTWCAIAMWPLMRRRWQRVAVLLYPLLTFLCIIVTANHYWLDGVGGLVVFSVGSLLGWRLHRWNQERLDRRFEARTVAAVDAQPTSVPSRSS